MRFLKTKVAMACKRAQEVKDRQTDPSTPQTCTSPSLTTIISKPFTILRDQRPKVVRKEKPKPKESIVSKNIIKNYGKAMAAFACSKLSKPYLEQLVEEAGLTETSFIHYMATYKECTDSIGGLRSLLLVGEDDSEEVAGYKKIFQSLCEVFLNYFAVNWIFGGKMMHKMLHLKFRCKMIRRVRNPEYFTYLTSKLK